MKVLGIKMIEDCFDGSFMKEVLLDSEISEPFVDYLSTLGEMSYHPEFARPFFRVESPGNFILKGVVGNKSMRVILYRSNLESAESYLIEVIKNFKDQGGDKDCKNLQMI